jgi:hypothetical protein
MVVVLGVMRTWMNGLRDGIGAYHGVCHATSRARPASRGRPTYKQRSKNVQDGHPLDHVVRQNLDVF